MGKSTQMMDMNGPILVSSLEEPLDRTNSTFSRLEMYINDTFCEILKRFDQVVFEIKLLENLTVRRRTKASCKLYTESVKSGTTLNTNISAPLER